MADAADPAAAGPTWSQAGPDAAPKDSPRTPPPPLLDTAQALLRELPGLLSDRVELLSLELRRAGLALAQIVVLVVAAAILGVTAWLALWVGVAMALVALGLPPLAALAIVLLINAIAVAVAVARAKSLTRLVSLPATRRHLTVKTAPGP